MAAAAAGSQSSTLCEVHNKPLKLFCQNDSAVICTECAKSKKHRDHAFLSIPEAAQKHKEMSGEERRNLANEFEQFHQAAKDQMQFLLSHLEELKVNILDYQKKNYTRQMIKITQLNILIGDIEKKCEQPETEFLKQMTQINSLVSNLGKLHKELHDEWLKQTQRSRSKIGLSISVIRKDEQWLVNLPLHPAAGQLTCGFTKRQDLKEVINLMGKMQSELMKVTYSSLKPYEKANVFFDQDTLNPMLALSDDNLTVQWDMELKEDIPWHWKRFEKHSCVLGSEGFTEGRFYWEINVEEGKIWAVGVAKESVERKHLVHFAPEDGIWGIGLDEQKYVAYTNSGVIPLGLTEPVQKIRVYLDYTAGQVSFFNAETDTWIFTFPPAHFSGADIYPWFWVEGGLIRLPEIDFEELATDLVWGKYSEVPLYGDPWKYFS
ncbi:zinc finger protein RFP-like [Candoia aspera]|uniref:zinc finger protein RFP-like n=1 Tax=Candoia aspera TaxID=51853 RepID=UPI002FD7F9FB